MQWGGTSRDVSDIYSIDASGIPLVADPARRLPPPAPLTAVSGRLDDSAVVGRGPALPVRPAWEPVAVPGRRALVEGARSSSPP